MDPLQSAVYDALAGHAGLSALVASRVYPDAAPQGVAKPYVVWQELSAIPTNDLGGSAETGGLDYYRIQVTFWDLNQTKSRAGNKQVRAAMIAASGFKSLHIDKRAMSFEPDTKLYGVQSDFSVWIKT